MLAHATGPVRRDVVEELQLYLHGLAFSDSPIHVSALSPDGRPLVVYEDARKTAEGLRSWSAKDAARWPAVPGHAAAARRVDRIALHQHAAVGGRAVGARCVRADAHARRFPLAAEGRSVAAAAMGTDGGRRPGQRIDRHRVAARDGCGGRHFRRHARPVVGRQRIAAAVDVGQSIARVARRAAWSTAGRSRSRARSRAAATRFGVEIRTGCRVDAHRGRRTIAPSA